MLHPQALKVTFSSFQAEYHFGVIKHNKVEKVKTFRNAFNDQTM